MTYLNVLIGSDGSVISTFEAAAPSPGPGLVCLSLTDQTLATLNKYKAAQFAVVKSGRALDSALCIVDGELAIRPVIQAMKRNWTKMLSNQCQVTCVGGFTSNALGHPMTYGSTMTDQQNYAFAVAAWNNSDAFTANVWCSDSTGVWSFVPHTGEQLVTLMRDCVAFIESTRSKLRDLVNEVNQVSDEPTYENAEKVRALAW